jgi:hypothetical protein
LWTLIDNLMHCPVRARRLISVDGEATPVRLCNVHWSPGF